MRLYVLRHGQSEVNQRNIFGGWVDVHLTEKGLDQARNSAILIKEYCQLQGLELPKLGYTSRLIRTEETMNEILKEFGKQPEFRIVSGELPPQQTADNGKFPVYQSWRLNERHYGSWQGQSKHKMLEEYGEEQYMYIRRDYFGKPPKADLNKEMVQDFDQGDTGYEFKEPNRHVKYLEEEITHDELPNGESLCDVVQRLNPLLANMILPNLKERGDSLIVGHGSTVRSLLKILEGISDSDIKEVNIPNAIPSVIELDDNFKFIRKFYLDPESAKVNAELVRQEGFKE
ncbi:Gpm2/Gpm3 [Kluyveromyces lactis]|nr:Gpm2/Gpm3 [Kluyveromyces lactis]